MKQIIKTLLFISSLIAVLIITGYLAFPTNTKTIEFEGLTYSHYESGFQPIYLLGYLFLIPLFVCYLYTYTIEDNFETFV